MGVRQRSGEGVVGRNGRQNTRMDSTISQLIPRFSSVLTPNLHGTDNKRTLQNTLLDNRFLTGLIRGASQKKLASEAYRAIGGVARSSIAYRVTIPTAMSTRQIRQNLNSATAKITDAPQNLLILGRSFRPTGDLALFSRHTGTLVGKFARITNPKFRGIWSDNVKNCLHPKTSQRIFSGYF